jgi:hypothetical protein
VHENYATTELALATGGREVRSAHRVSSSSIEGFVLGSLHAIMNVPGAAVATVQSGSSATGGQVDLERRQPMWSPIAWDLLPSGSGVSSTKRISSRSVGELHGRQR